MKVGVVGCGLVGSTAAYAMVMEGVGREIVMVDLDHKRAQAEADDIRHAIPFTHPLDVNAGDYSDLEGARVVIVSAGVGQRPGETRLQLLSRNAAVFKSVIPSILNHAPKTILLIASNPVDVMTHVAAHYASAFDVPPSRVIGSGTTLDTARFRTLLGNHFGVDAKHVHGYVIGEHGDSEVLTWSLLNVGGLRLGDTERLLNMSIDDEFKHSVDEQVRRAAYRIIDGKGATYYGIGAALSEVVDALIHDQRAIMTISTRVDGVMNVDGVTLSLPTLIGGEGVLSTIPLAIDDDEMAAFQASAAVIREATESLHDSL
jgi:L-lactate dehydrogenase